LIGVRIKCFALISLISASLGHLAESFTLHLEGWHLAYRTTATMPRAGHHAKSRFIAFDCEEARPLQVRDCRWF
jgi:hypothetical protein